MPILDGRPKISAYFFYSLQETNTTSLFARHEPLFEKSIRLIFSYGVKKCNLIFLLNTPEAWKNFIASKTRFGASAEASANDGVSGGSIEGAEYVAPGVWVFQMITKDLTLEVTLKGTKIYRDKKLN